MRFALKFTPQAKAAYSRSQKRHRKRIKLQPLTRSPLLDFFMSSHSLSLSLFLSLSFSFFRRAPIANLLLWGFQTALINPSAAPFFTVLAAVPRPSSRRVAGKGCDLLSSGRGGERSSEVSNSDENHGRRVSWVMRTRSSRITLSWLNRLRDENGSRFDDVPVRSCARNGRQIRAYCFAIRNKSAAIAMC